LKSIIFSIENLGFRQNQSKSFVNETNDFIQFIDFQLKSDKSSICLNIGAQPKFLNNEANTSADCFLRQRMSTNGYGDQWWFDTEGDASNIAKSIELACNTFFKVFSTLKGSLDEFSVTDFQGDGEFSGEYGFITDLNLIYLCSKTNIDMSNLNKALELARFGLSESGMAVGPKKRFKMLIKDLNNLLS